MFNGDEPFYFWEKKAGIVYFAGSIVGRNYYVPNGFNSFEFWLKRTRTSLELGATPVVFAGY